MAANDRDDDASTDSPDVQLLWVMKANLESVSKTLEDGKDVSKEEIEGLVDPDDVDDDAVLVPLDMSEADIADLDDLVATRGANDVAKLLMNARKLFLSNLEAMSPDDRADVPTTMTGAEYKERMEEEMARAAEAGESEAADCEESEEENEEVGKEPPAKKHKNS
eukprot:TRINITY_DN48197_c0_g1_i1.p1 TRINITY_DN48197_c0_g1~~TRINITY_DN48197_c0_g1_i1.p1  ORF type:complete len:165 (+),score=54.29 TRINITY_DN48197_c0_g1_i1:49-543(+)